MPEDDATVEERLAVRLIHEFKDVAHVERLEPEGSVPTPDWRLTMADGRVADVEVTRDTVQSWESQLGVAQVDESTGRSRWVEPGMARFPVVLRVACAGIRP